jgi:hypothetical protein
VPLVDVRRREPGLLGVENPDLPSAFSVEKCRSSTPLLADVV